RIGDTSFKPDFAKNSVLEQLYNGATIPAGTKIKMGSSISLVLGDGVGKIEFVVPSIIGLTYQQAKMILETNGLSIGAIVADPLVKDTMNAYIYKQNPQRVDDEGKRLRIRPGQTMDVWLSVDKPIVDSAGVKEVPEL
ncbi:MAG: PASTA domain-containing protein, partial [Bacteroidota bacterium]|nr:PASTA domain-containing protein [Bacteroidota bacterium]